MGRQILFHMLKEDCEHFLQFVQGRDPVVVTLRDADSPHVEAVPDPASETRDMVLWNKVLLDSLERELVVRPPASSYYRVDQSLPVLELVPSKPCDWNGRRALLQGRVYGFFDRDIVAYESWYNAIARWIRANFVKNPLELLGGYVGPSALKWFQDGGVLLPMYPIVPNPRWVSFVESQHSTGESAASQ
jgi:hypothetical protein